MLESYERKERQFEQSDYSFMHILSVIFHHCLCVALWWTSDPSRVYPASRPMTAGIGSSPPRPNSWIKQV